VKKFKQASQHRLRHSVSGRVWQKGFYDRVVRREEGVERVAEYTLNNPVRKGLSRTWFDYPHSWSRWHKRV
jgi:putative transposase